MGRSPLFVKWSLSIKGWKTQSSVQQAHMMTVFVIQNIMHFLKRNLKQGSSYPPLFSFAFTRPTLNIFLKIIQRTVRKGCGTWPCWNQGPALYYSPVYRSLQWIEWIEWVPRLHQRGTFFFFLKNNYISFKSISPLTLPIPTKCGGVAFKWESLCH